MEHGNIEVTLSKLLDAHQAHQGPEESMRSRLSKTTNDAPLDHGIRRLGYVLGKELGRGALGRVNLATQQVFDRAVAVKRLLHGGNDHESSLKFYSEAIVTSQLEHPNIVPIHDLLANADGSLQLVMKRVEGISWRDLLRPKTSAHKQRSEQFSLDDHVDILLKVCDAVAFAHGRGILHRDIKPENVMVGEFGEVLLMDWGCAVAFGETEHHPIVPRVEEITEVTGTPSYMAPEMALIRNASIGPCSDVYQLGAVLYELLTGMHPNRGKTVLEVLTSAVQGPLSDPQLIAPERFIPEELASIAMAALVKDPKRRLCVVSQFVERLRNYRRHVQAIVLVGTARGQLSLASSSPRMADEALRKATSWAEQALEIWPNWSGAKTVLLDARLASAQHSFLHGSYTLSAQQATAAAQLAKELQRTELEDNAASLASKAQFAVATRATRNQRMRLVRIGGGCLLVLLVVTLGFYLEVLNRRQQQLSSELQKAQSAAIASDPSGNSGARTEHDQDTAGRPSLDQAQLEIANHQWAAAASGLDQIIANDPHPLTTRIMRMGANMAQKQYAAAAQACKEWLELSPNDPQAKRMAQILHGLHDGAELEPETSAEVAQCFTSEQLPTLAAVFALTLDHRLAVYRDRINATWPGLGDGLSIDENGRITANGRRWSAGLAQHRDLNDISALHDIPLAEVDLSNTEIRSITALHGMPLESVNLDHTAIYDLTPLAGAPLYELDIADTRISDLSPLSLGKLRILQARHSRLSDLTPLHGLSFLSLDCSDTKVSNLAFMEKTTQGSLDFENCPIRDLTPLVSCTIAQLDLAGCPQQDAETVAMLNVGTFTGVTNANATSLRSISRMRGGRLDLGTAPALADLSPIASMHLTWLAFHGSRVTSLAPLQGMPLQVLICDHNPISDLSALRGCSLTTLDISACPVRDLAAVSRLPLESLHASETPITTQMLTTLLHLPLKELWIDHSRVTDLALLASLPLVDLRAGPFADWRKAGIDGLRRISTLRYIGVSATEFMEASEFWAELDAGTLPLAFRQ